MATKFALAFIDQDDFDNEQRREIVVSFPGSLPKDVAGLVNELAPAANVMALDACYVDQEGTGEFAPEDNRIFVKGPFGVFIEVEQH